MTTYLYRAVNAEPITVLDGWDSEAEVVPTGEWTFGRQSGYLSRSGAVSAGQRSEHPFEILRSEPVVFLTRREKLLREIKRLQSELVAEVAAS